MEDILPEAGEFEGNSAEQLFPDLVRELIGLLSPSPSVSLATDPLFATPNDAYNVLLELVRSFIPSEKQHMFVQASGKGTTLESALSPEFVFNFALEELQERCHLPKEPFGLNKIRINSFG
jgi:hypothetical protein